MKTIGMLGGMSWESTVTYYQIVNEVIRRELGGLHSAKCILHSVEFDEIERCQTNGEWEKAGDILGRAAKGLEDAGADYILICTKTRHKAFDQVQSYVSVPLLHIAQVTADALTRDGITKVGLLGTKYTMEQDFYKAKLVENGIEVVIPGKADIEDVNRVIFQELCVGEVKAASQEKFLAVIREMAENGAQAVILGCTEIGLLVRQKDTDVKLYDTTLIHAETAAMMSLAE